jgi:transposase
MTNNKLHHSAAYLKKRYVVEKKSIDAIAKECGVSVQIIYKQLNKFGLRR